MDNQQLLAELQQKLTSGEISQSELAGLLPHTEQESTLTRFTLTKILYGLGAIIVTIGILFFVAQLWNTIGTFGRILVTLGTGLVFAGTGSVLLTKEKERMVGAIFHIVGGILIPAGMLVTFNEFGIEGDIVNTSLFVVLTGVYVFLSLLHKHPVPTLFAIINATIATYLITDLIINPQYFFTDVYEYLTVAIGATYLLLGTGFKQTYDKPLSGALYFFGSIFFLGATFSLSVDHGIFWHLLYFGIAIEGLHLSTRLHSKSILVISTLALIAHISYITGKYFADSIGWPVALVFLGLIFIGLGYMSVKINEKYLK